MRVVAVVSSGSWGEGAGREDEWRKGYRGKGFDGAAAGAPVLYVGESRVRWRGLVGAHRSSSKSWRPSICRLVQKGLLDDFWTF